MSAASARIRRSDENADLRAENARLRHAISGLIPWVAGSGRGAAQEALADACALIGADPFLWSQHPDVLIRRRPKLERRRPARASGVEETP